MVAFGLKLTWKIPPLSVTLIWCWQKRNHRTFGPVVSNNPLDLLSFTRDRANGPALISKTVFAFILFSDDVFQVKFRAYNFMPTSCLAHAQWASIWMNTVYSTTRIEVPRKYCLVWMEALEFVIYHILSNRPASLNKHSYTPLTFEFTRQYLRNC